jgi:hypothetical protein
VLSPRYPHSNSLPWDELVVLHPPCHDILMIHEEELYACNFAVRRDLAAASI